MKKQIVIVALLLLSIVAGGYFIYQREVQPETLIGQTEVMEANVYSPDGETVSGYWLFELVVNNRDELEFTVGDGLSKQLKEDLSKGLPPGSEIRARDKISVITNPSGNPFMDGPVQLEGYVYDDLGYERQGGKHRVYRYYVLGEPEWNAVHVPYEVSVRRNDSPIYGPKQFLSGDTSWDTDEISDLPLGIEIREFGQIGGGIITPQDKYAYIWVEKDGKVETRLVPYPEVRNQLRAGYRNTTKVSPIGGDVIDKWNEVTSGADISGDEWMPTLWDMQHYPDILKNFTEPRSEVPTHVKQFTQEAPSLYTTEVPHDEEADPWNRSLLNDDFEKVANYQEMTAIRTLEESTSAQILLKVPADAFSSWVYKPPYGIPEIVDKTVPKAKSGTRSTIAFQVKNVGPTGDTFTATLDYPKARVDDSPGNIYIPAGEVRRFEFVVSASASGAEQKLSGSITVQAIESGKSAFTHFEQTWGAFSDEPLDGYGSIVGEVVNAKDQPIINAEVQAGGKLDLTDTGGTFQISEIPAGNVEITVSREGYGTKNIGKYVQKDKTTNVGKITLYSAEEDGFPWLPVLVGVFIVLIMISVVYYYRNKIRR